MVVSTDGVGLGRVQRLHNLREVWPSEGGHFTPWLANNIEVLSETIGLPLTVVQHEVPVVDFRLAIHAVDPDGRAVIIENQLEPSDHAHLGQLLLYASGLEASTVIWITTRIREEHRSALTWLNDHTDSNVRVFGIEVGVVQIGQSVQAPVFDVVVEPNDWSKAAKRSMSAPTAQRNQARMLFFERVADLLASEYPKIRMPRTQVNNWCSFAAGPFGYFALSFARQGYRVEVYLDTGERESTKRLYEELYSRRAKLQTELGFELVWDRLEVNRGSRIACYLAAFDLATSDPQTKESAAHWSKDRIIAMHRVLDPELRRLTAQLRPVDSVSSVNGDLSDAS